ncbi:MAG: transglycosylase domain-containing protein [Bacteroidaceae bacterium]|nr:transglycosylase domain-containing protein [Bacteroidaceae bacterium]
MYKKIIIGLWVAVVTILLLTYCALYAISKGWLGEVPIPDPNNPINKYASRIYTDDGQLLGTWNYASENRVMVTYDSLPDNLIKALVATEDVRFFDHSGIDMKALGRAIVKRGIFGQKSAGGGSTITQQLAKLLYTDVARNAKQRMLQKPIEWFVAVKLERYYTKEEIITMYLNDFDFLNNAVGIKNAAKTYFGKSPKDLTLTESATLVGMCKNPSLFNPRRFNERSRERRNVVLLQMYKAGYITKEQCDSASQEELSMAKFHVLDHKDGLAPYFREYLREIMMASKPDRDRYASWQGQKYHDDSLAWETNPLYGWCNKNRKRDGSNYNIYTDGLKIYTTLDSRMQKYAEEAAYEHVAKYLQPAFDKEKKGSSIAPYSGITKAQFKSLMKKAMKQTWRYRKMKDDGCSEEEIEKAFNTKVPMTIFTYDGEKEVEMTPLDSIRYYKSFLRTAMMAMDPRNGAVKAYVGGLNYKYFMYDNVLGGGRRQVGSTMKPFLYSFAMENNWSPCDELLNTQPKFIIGPDTIKDVWIPRNDNRERYGEMVDLSWGLSRSNNWIAARLMNELSPQAFVRFLHEQIGLENQDIYPALSVCLGPCDISVGEMVSAYTMFANKGNRYRPLLVTRIEDSDGNIVATFNPMMKSAISAESCYKMIYMMRKVINGGTGGRLRYQSRPYKFTADMIGKTGTTNSNADAWFMGVVPKLVVGCWVGGDDRDIHFGSMNMGQGASAALPIYGNFMLKVFGDPSLGITQEDEFEIPENFEFCHDDLSHLQEASEGIEINDEGVDASFR